MPLDPELVGGSKTGWARADDGHLLAGGLDVFGDLTVGVQVDGKALEGADVDRLVDLAAVAL